MRDFEVRGSADRRTWPRWTWFACVAFLACGSETAEVPEAEEESGAAPAVDFIQEAAWSPRGDRLLATWNQGTRFRLYGVMAPDTTGAMVEPSTGLRVSDGPDMYGTWGPNRQWVAFASTRDGNSEIYRMRPDGMQPENLTNHPATDTEPSYSPDGRSIAFISDRTDGAPRLHIMNADGSDVQMVSSPPGSAHASPEWAPDGSRILVTVTIDAEDFVHVATPIGSWGRVKRGANGSWAPDSNVIYMTRGDSLYAARISTNGWLSLGIEGSAPAVSPDGRWLAFVRGEYPQSALYALDLETREEFRLTR